MSPRSGHIPTRSTPTPLFPFFSVDNPSHAEVLTAEGNVGNPVLAHAVLTTREQEREFAFAQWLDEATAAKLRKADRRRKEELRRIERIRSLPERLAAQQALMDANGGRMPPRWRYEDATKKVDGKVVAYRKKVANRPAYISVYNPVPRVPEAIYDRAAERRDRIDNGFLLREDIVLSGHLVRKGLRFEGYKSEALGTDSALRWPALLHKSRSLRVCWRRGSRSALDVQVAAARSEGVPDWMIEHDEDDVVEDPNLRVLEYAHHKVLGLDAPDVEGNKTLLGFLRLDTDLTWKSVEHLLRELRKKVKAGKIRSLPNFIVGIKTPDGRLVRPHLIWLLPVNMGVLNRDGTKPLKKFKSVYYGLCRALADLGADPEAPATSQLVKNPLSPLYHTECPTDEWPTLDEHAECLDMGLDRATLVREAVATVTGEVFKHSNQYFNGCLDAARGVMAKWHRDRDPFYVEALKTKDFDLLIDRLQESLSNLVVETGMKPKSMEYARQKVAKWVVGTWNPSKLTGTSLPTRGRLKHVVEDIKGTDARQAVAGRHSAALRADRTIERLVEAWDKLVTDGTPTKSALAKASGLSRRTVINRFDDLQEALSQRDVKDALMLYGQGNHAEPEQPHSIPVSQGNDTEDNWSPVETDTDDDVMAVERHLAWIDSLDTAPPSTEPEVLFDALEAAFRENSEPDVPASLRNATGAEFASDARSRCSSTKSTTRGASERPRVMVSCQSAVDHCPLLTALVSDRKAADELGTAGGRVLAQTFSVATCE